MIMFVNEMTKRDVRPARVLAPFLLLLSPFAPHMAEEPVAAPARGNLEGLDGIRGLAGL